MKTQLKKLRELARLRHVDRRDKRQRQSMSQWEEIGHAYQEMQDIKDCYERLLSGAAATTNSVYEFSESLVEIGNIFLEKTALNNFDDEETDKVLLSLGKVQLQMQRIFDVYRSHIYRTLTVPSESLLNELQTVEAMKTECEGKRLEYEEALKRYKEKGKLRGSKSDCFTSQHLQAASDEYDQEVNALLFRMRSLQQGQCRSLLTQGIRHHVAQLTLFKNVHHSLEEIAPCVKHIAECHHIDYDIGELEVDSIDDDDAHETGEGNDADADARSSVGSELGFDHKPHRPRHKTTDSMEDVEPLSPGFASQKDVKATSKSAPLFPDRSNPNFKPIVLRSSSSKKHGSYALPTPSEARSPVSKAGVPDTRDASLSSPHSHHSSPLANNKYEKVVANDVVSAPLLTRTKSILQSSPVPPPLVNGLSPPNVDPSFTSNTKKKRHCFSGPTAGKQWQNKQAVTGSSPLGSPGHPLLSRSFLISPRERPVLIPKLPSYNSSHFISSPKISELHELPRPPPNLAFKTPLPKGIELYAANKVVGSAAVSMHPMPSPLSRSYSIPTRGLVTEPMVDDTPSSPRTPIPP